MSGKWIIILYTNNMHRLLRYVQYTVLQYLQLVMFEAVSKVQYPIPEAKLAAH